MGAIAVSSLNSANWIKSKPADYKGQDLDKALKAYEVLAAKGVSMPNSLPKLPKPTIKEINSCITDLEATVTEFHKTLATLNQIVAALQAIQGAAGKATADLQKLAKGKDADKDAYDSAIAAASAAGSAAVSAMAELR